MIEDECGCPAIEVVGPHTNEDHEKYDCGFARWGRTDMACGGCYGCIMAQVIHYNYIGEQERRDGV